jgi:GDPmannose 4,6-dehydratase
MTKAFITGITGQDGSYLAQLLINSGYEVYGLVSGQNINKQYWLNKNLPQIKLINGDLRDLSSLISAIDSIKPDYVYNLGALSFVGNSWKQPELVGEITGLGVLRVLEAVRIVTKSSGKKIKFYQASSSEMFGKVRETPQNELTPFHPRSPYGVAKVYGHNITVNYRESYDMFACSGILFNHESPRRGVEFVTRKISLAVSNIVLGNQKILKLGNLDSKRDWGYAGDYVEAMKLMIEQDSPKDYVIATGESYSIKDFCKAAFQVVGIDNWEEYVVIDESLKRPAEVDLLIGNFKKAKDDLGWAPKTNFQTLVQMMVESDLNQLKSNN